MIKLRMEDWRNDNRKISDLIWKIESTGTDKQIEQAYDFIHHACDNIDDVVESGSYDFSEASWGYGTDFIIDELRNILTKGAKGVTESYKRLYEQDVDKEFMMTIKISSSLYADGCDIQISDGEDVVYEESYRYGYNASYDRGFANKDKPYIADIITNLCKKYHINKKNIVFENGFNVFYGTKNGVSDKEVKDFIKKYISFAESLKLKEQDVEIEVKHEGILEVPEGKNVDDLPISHFEKLAKKKGLGKITKALNNLQVWNKNDDPKLSKWAGDMIDKLNKRMKKDESFIRESGAKSYWRYNYMNIPDSMDRNGFFHYYDKNSIRRIKLTPCDNPDDCYTYNTQAVCNYEYPYQEVFCTKDQAYEYLLVSMNTSIYEREHDL